MPFLKPLTLAVIPGLLYTFLQFLLIPAAIANEPVTVTSGQYQTAVIELYTSEGCSSCPPADRWFNELVNLPDKELDVLALAFHVDYWDYIGWKDIYANPAYTNRQRNLARINQQKSVYTPEFFVNGIEARGTRSVIKQAQSTNKLPSRVKLKLEFQQQQNKVVLNLTSQLNPVPGTSVRFVIFENHLSSDVKRGENEGKRLQHQQVVRYLSPKNTLFAETPYSIKIEPQWKQNNLGIAALVQSSDGTYLQAIYSQLNPDK